MTFFIRSIFALFVILSLTAISAAPASAGDPQIEEAQRQGVVGERIDGFLGVVSGNVDPSLLRRVNEINAKRRALYDQTAQRTGTTMAQVARVTGEKQIANAPAGSYILGLDGRWVQK